MIYIENKDDVQRVVIPTNDNNVEFKSFTPIPEDSNYYTKGETNELIAESRTAVLGEVGDWLSDYPTTDHMHDAIEEAVKDVDVDLTGYATEQWVKDQNYTTDEWVLQQKYATEDYVDAEIQRIPKPDMSDYYTKEETDGEIDNALLAAPSMLENAGFATQNWVKDQNYTTDHWVLEQNYATQDWVKEQDYATTQYVDDAIAEIPTGGGSGTGIYFLPIVGTTLLYQDVVYAYENAEKNVVVAVCEYGEGYKYYMPVFIERPYGDAYSVYGLYQQSIYSWVFFENDYSQDAEIIKLGSGGTGGSADVNWNDVPYIYVKGSAQFDSEVHFYAGGVYEDISSGIACAFKTGRSQSTDQWTRFIHAGTNGDNIYFVSSDEAGNTQLAMIDTEGNIYEGKDKLSDKYASKDYVDEIIVNINNLLSNI